MGVVWKWSPTENSIFSIVILKEGITRSMFVTHLICGCHTGADAGLGSFSELELELHLIPSFPKLELDISPIPEFVWALTINYYISGDTGIFCVCNLYY